MNNPYAPPDRTDESDPFGQEHSGPQDQLAGRFARFAAVFVDGFLMLIVLSVLSFVNVVAVFPSDSLVYFATQVLVVQLAFLLLHGTGLASRGQSLGKMLIGIQIVDNNTGDLLPFYRVYVYRYLWFLPIEILAGLIPGSTVVSFLGIVLLIGFLMIFGEERRCLHDHIAGSKVVEYREGRRQMN